MGRPAWDSRAACTDNVIEDSYFDTRVIGVYLDEGTTRTTVRNSTFVHQRCGAIGNYAGVGNLWDTTGNDYGSIARRRRRGVHAPPLQLPVLARAWREPARVHS